MPTCFYSTAELANGFVSDVCHGNDFFFGETKGALDGFADLAFVIDQGRINHSKTANAGSEHSLSGVFCRLAVIVDDFSVTERRLSLVFLIMV